ncbi:MAG: type II toxin-antitoxin system VapC family toxin [Chloroflexi bacterium]|nr:type II toxin-antitoxin system VapC family toxin [Chloroflexota bacterium]
MSWLVDTIVLSELRKGPRGHPRVQVWGAATHDEDLFTSVLVLGEIQRGIDSIRRRDVPSALALEQWLHRLTDNFSDRILPIDSSIAMRWGALNVPDPLPTVDGLLAATALVHDLTLVTRNTRDVERTGVRMFDPFLS